MDILSGILGLVIVLGLVILAVMAFLMPFFAYLTQRNTFSIVRELKEMNQRFARAEQHRIEREQAKVLSKH